MTLIYIMCHTNPNFHWLQDWFRQEAEKLKLQNITYKYVDIMKKKHVMGYQQRSHDIEADILKGNPNNYPLADIVYVPDCGGDWYHDQGPTFKPEKMIEHVSKLFEWVKEGGYLYVSKLMNDNIKIFFTDVLEFEQVVNTWGEGYPLDFYRKKKIAPLKL